MVVVRFAPSETEKDDSNTSKVDADDELNSGVVSNWLLDDLDTEEEHLLNFFMSDMASGSNPIDDLKYPTQNDSSASVIKRPSDALPSILKQPTMYESIMDHDPITIPSTPATAFYPRSAIQKHSTVPANDSNRSYNVENEFGKFQGFPDHPYEPLTDSVSPISPAAMGTTEVLMLPSSNTSFIPSMSSSSLLLQPQLDQVHIAPANLPPWLQHLNMVASISANDHMTSQLSQSISSTTEGLKSSSSTFPNLSKHHPMNFHPFQATNTCSNNPIYINPITSVPIYTKSQDDIPVPDSVLTSARSIANIFSATQKVKMEEENNQESEVETEEKRARRLARNRESARQSRRRKKELLLSLRDKVNKLHDRIEDERKLQLETMEEALLLHKNQMLQEIFKRYSDPLRSQSIEKLIYIIKNESPATTARLAAIEFQFRQLCRLVLPPCEHFLLYLTLQDSSFFSTTKESIQKIRATSTEKASPGRISSRMAGEEIVKIFEEEIGESYDGKPSCKYADEKLWPLFCLELVIGMEQEEKLLQVFNTKMKPDFNHSMRENLLNHLSSVESTKQKFLSSCCAVRNRSLTNLLHILSPAQTIRYLQWMRINRERCKHVLSQNESNPNHSVDKLFEAMDIKRLDD